MNEHYDQWNRLSPLGLLIIGLGISLTGDAIMRKTQGKGWFLRGTLGLVLTNAGIAVFGEAVKHRALYEARLEQLRKDD